MKTRLQCQLDKNRILKKEISQLKHIVEFYNRNFSRIFEEQLMKYREFKTMEIEYHRLGIPNLGFTLGGRIAVLKAAIESFLEKIDFALTFRLVTSHLGKIVDMSNQVKTLQSDERSYW